MRLYLTSTGKPPAKAMFRSQSTPAVLRRGPFLTLGYYMESTTVERSLETLSRTVLVEPSVLQKFPNRDFYGTLL